VDRDVRAGRDGDLRLVVAVKFHIERERGRSAARRVLDSLAKASPRGGRGEVGLGLDPAAFACSQQNFSGRVQLAAAQMKCYPRRPPRVIRSAPTR
jgi:hypothetical protein